MICRFLLAASLPFLARLAKLWKDCMSLAGRLLWAAIHPADEHDPLDEHRVPRQRVRHDDRRRFLGKQSTRRRRQDREAAPAEPRRRQAVELVEAAAALDRAARRRPRGGRRARHLPNGEVVRFLKVVGAVSACGGARGSPHFMRVLSASSKRQSIIL